MASRITRHFVGLIFWTLVAAAFAAIAVKVILANYLACKAAFELLGFEMRPLSSDELVGEILGAFFPNATLAHLYALAVALTIAGGYFLFFHLAFHIHDLIDDRKVYLIQGDEPSAHAAMRLIIRDAITMVAFLIPLVVATNWDIDLFRYRSIASALHLEDPQVAASTIKAWEIQLREHGDLFAWSAARWGAWGYLAVTALACLCLEVAFRKVSGKWDSLCGTVGELFKPADQSGDGAALYGYDENGQPVYDPQAPLSYDVNGNPVEQGDLAEPALQPEDNVSTPGAAPAPAAEAEAATQAPPNGNGVGHAPPTFGALFDEPPAPQAAPEPAAAAPAAGTRPVAPEAESDLHDVIGGDHGERVSLRAARADRRRFHVDMATGRIWRREHWERVHGPRGPFEGAGEAQAA